jgi:hypothetical protein
MPSWEESQLGIGGTLPRFDLQPESETPEDSPLLQVKPLPDASRRCAFRAVISLTEVARVSRLIMNNCFPQARYLSCLDECYGDLSSSDAAEHGSVPGLLTNRPKS